MAFTNINKSSDYFSANLYTGNGGNQTITGVNHQPDMVWFKSRDAGNSHALVDIVRGTTKVLYPDTNSAEQTISAQTFNSDGFALVQDAGANSINSNGSTKVAWSWKAGAGQGSSNTDGSINTTYTSVNTTAGFSISLFAGTGANATVGHGLGGLGVAPEWVIIKGVNNTGSWTSYHKALGATKYMHLSETDAAATASSVWNSTAPTNQVFSVGAGSQSGSGNTYVAYCFAPIKGFSAMGSYKGNGNADGPFIFTNGMKPSFVIIKNTSSTNHWIVLDNKREGYNPQKYALFPNRANAEAGDYLVDFTANGFKVRTATGALNENGETLIYMAFAEAPLVGSNNIPANAR